MNSNINHKRRSKSELKHDVANIRPIIMNLIMESDDKRMRPIDIAKKLCLSKEKSRGDIGVDNAIIVALRELSDEGYLQSGKYYTLIKDYNIINIAIVEDNDNCTIKELDDEVLNSGCDIDQLSNNIDKYQLVNYSESKSDNSNYSDLSKKNK